MIINVTYDPSVAKAPAGYKQAVAAAVQYLDSQLTTQITVNITFGFGTIAGQAMDSGAVGESSSNGYGVGYAQVLQGLAESATSPADLAAIGALATGDPTGGAGFFVTSAEAKAFGQLDPADPGIDGYVSLGSNVKLTYDPAKRAVAGAYDAIGTLEHEITEVLGRISGLDQVMPVGQQGYSPLDLFRYTAAGARDLHAEAAYFSPDGKTFPLIGTAKSQFNDPANGGDGGDLTNAGDDAFSAYGSPGKIGTISTADLEMMDVLGYALASGAAPAPAVEAATGISGRASYDGAATDTVTVSGKVIAEGVMFAAQAHAANYGFANAGTITVTGGQAIAVYGADAFNNSGTIIARNLVQVSGSIGLDIDAVAAPTDPGAIVNSGTISADVAIYDQSLSDKTITNSGQITGDLYFGNSAAARHVTINNTGTIIGNVIFNNGTDTYNGAGGKLFGNIFLGSGTNTVTLGNDGEAVFGGGQKDTITGGKGNDFIAIAAGTNAIDGGGGVNTLSFAGATGAVTVDLGAGTASAAGSDTIANIQTVIGSNYNDTIKAGVSGAELIAGSGAARLIGGAGNDTLIAGSGGDTISGGGGTNRFIYSAGDGPVVITDFGVAGATDTLLVYGYGSAQSVAKQGADTLITLAPGDTILLQGVLPSSVTAGNAVYNSSTYVLPVQPGTAASVVLDLTANYTVSSSDVIYQSQSPTGVIEDVKAAGRALTFANKGQFTVANEGSVAAIVVNSGTSAASFANNAGATFTVQSTDGAAIGHDSRLASAVFANAGTYTVTALDTATGVTSGGNSLAFSNAASGVLTVTSRGGKAIGLSSANFLPGTAPATFTNNGAITVSGASAATAVDIADFAGGALTNGGTITSSTTLTNGVAIGIAVAGFDSAAVAGQSGLRTITNSGTITAQTAISGVTTGYDAATTGSASLDIVNSGTINGAITLGDGNNRIDNTGTITGAITFGTGAVQYNGASGQLHGSISLGNGTAPAGAWGALAASGLKVTLHGARTTVTGGNEVVTFAADGPADTVGLYASAGNWDTITGSGGTVYLTSAQAAVAGGGDVISFAGGSGNVAGLYDTGGNWDSVWAPGGATVYLTSAQAAITGGGNTISFAGGTGNIAGLYNTGGTWDSVWAPGGETIYLTSAQAAITGGGNVIGIAGGTGNVAGLYNTGGTWDHVWGANATIYFTSAKAAVTGGGNAISFAGGTGNAATLQDTAGVADTAWASNGTLFLDNAQVAVTGSHDTITFTGTSTASVNGTNEAFVFQAGIGGKDSVTGFATSDTLQFSTTDFSSWAALMNAGALTQMGADTVITLNAGDTVTLKGVTASTLTAAQFHFA